MSWISKKEYYKVASKCNVKTLRYYSFLYNDENKKKDGKVGMLCFGGFFIDLPKEQAKKKLPPNVKINPTKRLDQMLDLMNGRF